MSAASLKVQMLAFDIGGVFFLGKTDSAFFERWSAHASLDLQTLSRLLWFGPDIEEANIGRISAETYFARTATRLNTDTDIVRAIVEDAFVGELNEELVAFTRYIRTRVRVMALTNNWSFAQELLERHRIAELFEVVISSADVGIRKPHAGIYQIMLDRLGVAAGEIIFVDDALENVEAAQALGIRGLHFKSTAQAIAALTQIIGQ